MSFSVLLSVYKGDNSGHLNSSLRSIWDEQTLKPGQIVLVEDGPLGPSLSGVVEYWRGKLGATLEVVSLVDNVGLGAALNEGLRYCRYDLVARMDADDVSFPERFEKQVAFMRRHTEVTASSAQVEEWDFSLSELVSVRTVPVDPRLIIEFAQRRNPLSHPVAIFRKAAVLDVGGYPPLRKAQDYALWSLLLTRGYILGNQPETLLKMRTGTDLLNRRGWEYFKYEYQLLKYQKEIGFFPVHTYVRNLAGRFVLRMLPNVLKSYAYTVLR